MEVNCLFCNIEYERPKSYRSKYNFCSKECKEKYLKIHKSFDSIELICPVCERVFYKQKRFFDSNKTHCCSKHCSTIYRKKENNRICPNCNKPFRVKPGRLKKQNFCSRKCQDEYRGKNYLPHIDDIINLHLQGQYDKDIAEKYNVSRVCISNVIKKYYYEKNNIKINRHSKINDIELRKRISESVRKYFEVETEDKNLYNNISSIARKLFSHISYLIKVKNNFVCQKCGKRGCGKIETHHIYKESLIIKDFINNCYKKENGPITYQLMNYKPFTNENNLMVLCKECHLKEHYSKSGIN